jgi:hypothetical protein
LVLAVIEYFKDYPDSCHRPKEDVIGNAGDPRRRRLQAPDRLSLEKAARAARLMGALHKEQWREMNYNPPPGSKGRTLLIWIKGKHRHPR